MRARKPTCHSWRMVVPSQRRSCVQRTAWPAQCLRRVDLGHAGARRGLARPGAAPMIARYIACVAMDSRGRAP
jgi:hypothetical protein